MTAINLMSEWEMSSLPVLNHEPCGSLIQQLTRELQILAVSILWSGIGVMAGLILAFLLLVISIPCDPMSAMLVGGALSGTAGALLEMNLW